MKNIKTEEEMLKWFTGHHLVTKDQVLAKISEMISNTAKRMQELPKEFTEHLAKRRQFLNEFYSKVNDTVLFEKLEPWWSYQIVFTSRGVKLRLGYAKTRRVTEDGRGVITKPDPLFTVIEMDARSLTVDEYAEAYDMKPGAVRQALRRGKIRSAYKDGSGWHIPELAVPIIGRGYQPAIYEWKEPLTDVPKGFEYLREPTWIRIWQDDIDKVKYHVSVARERIAGEPVHTEDKADVERLELYLIANQKVTCRNDEQVYM